MKDIFISIRKFHVHIFVICVLCCLLIYPSFAGEIYKWIDNDGNMHFSDSPAAIPPEHKGQVEINQYRKSPPSSPETVAPNNMNTGIEPPSMEATINREPQEYEVSYTAYEGISKRIIVSVTFNGQVTANMALDTGAPGMVIKPELAERLGLFDLDHGSLAIIAGGIGGSAPAIWTVIDTIRIGEAEDEFIPTTVTSLNTPAFDGLIGMDFMSGYSIQIDPARKVVIFRELPPNPNAPGNHDEEWWRTKFRQFASMRQKWKEYVTTLDRVSRSSTEGMVRTDEVRKAQSFAEKQYQEADKLYFKLNSYATRHAVPMHWREY